jgi:hypothetical protein
LIQEEIKFRLNLGNATIHSTNFCLLPKNVKVRTCKIKNLPVVCTCGKLALRVLRKISGPRIVEVPGGWRKLHRDQYTALVNTRIMEKTA